MKNTLDQIVENIPKKDRENPTIIFLLEQFEQQFEIILTLKEQNQILKDEIARLKNQNPKPKIKPSKLPKDPQPQSSSKRSTQKKKKKKTATLKIDKEERIAPEHIPEGSIFKGLNPYTVRGLRVVPFNIRYLLEQWQTPEGNIVAGKLPSHVDGHFDSVLKSFILYQYHHCHVTQPLILEQLREWNIDISPCQINRILNEGKDQFHAEKDDILQTGLQFSDYINVDDTGARHNGKNGYCTHIGNEFFAWFKSTESKSRINFLQLLCASETDYLLSDDAFQYMIDARLPKSALSLLQASPLKTFTDSAQWKLHLKKVGIVKPRHIQIATEGALLANLLFHIPKKLVIVSDDAGQFNILSHSLCWVHAERTLAKLIVPSTKKQEVLEKVRQQVWDFYDELKTYKENPSEKENVRLQKAFDDIFTQYTDFQLLNLALKRLHTNKSELLLVLDRPEIPLHNNLSENDIREYVKKRKISGSTRSEAGQKCRDTFASLKKTCRKLGISFWQFLNDRLSGNNLIVPLSQIIEQRALSR
ncbi:IS66 family transposase [Candidatus Electrothrix sp.]|uniref:IS66 family transposase n=1 Tax=Candidatus Electrothrix sp. TaxID=2170559 RepID=UPI00405751DE